MPFIVFYMTLCWISTHGTKIVAWRSRHSISFFGRRATHSSRRGGRSHHMHSPCGFFWHIKGKSTQAKTQAKRKQNARNMRVFPVADDTAPAPFSPSLMDENRNYVQKRNQGGATSAWDMDFDWKRKCCGATSLPIFSSVVQHRLSLKKNVVWHSVLATHGFQSKEKMYNIINTIHTFWSYI